MTDDVLQFAARMRTLEALACPTREDIPYFNRHILVASSLGMNYREGLEYIIRMRQGGSH